jgi:predicted HTH domain antitoxin
MAVTIDLPKDIEASLRKGFDDFDAAMKEAALVELYRQGKISPRELSEAMGISRLERDAVLKKHNVTEDLPTAAEIAQDVENLRRLLEK